MHAMRYSWRKFEELDSFAGALEPAAEYARALWMLTCMQLEPGADYARSLKGGELACTSGKLEPIVQYCMQ